LSKKNRKKPSSRVKPTVSKAPRSKRGVEDWRQLHFQLRFHKMDWGGAWSWNACEQSDFCKILKRFGEFEKLKWKEIDGREHHHQQIADLSNEAQKRLVELKHQIEDFLYSIRVDGPGRVWGIRYRDEFHVLWWDPEHSVRPTSKKRT
jgi:hypothetical protein